LNFVWFFRLGRVSELSLPYKEVGGGKTEKERERERDIEDLSLIPCDFL
jgi:hypothetical protein